MRKFVKHLPVALCILYAFYPLMQLLGGKLKFGYELRSPALSTALTASITIAAAFLLLKEKPVLSPVGRIALALTLPLCCIHTLSMFVVMDSILTLAMMALSCIACCVLYFARNFQRWYTRVIGCIVLFPMLAYVSIFLLMGGFMFDFGYTELLRSYEKDGYLCYDYYVDEGALGEGWYTDVYSKNSYPLVFGTFHTHYERIYS